MPDSVELVYVADPLCSWCWGFVPVLDQLRAGAAAGLPFRLVMGGLRPGPYAQPVNEGMLNHLRKHWEAVHQCTGQPFNFDYFSHHGAMYDTEPASRAVVAMRSLAPQQAYPFLLRIQAAFYRDTIDCTSMTQLEGLAQLEPVDPGRFREVFRDPASLHRSRQDYSEARRMGIHSFPALVIRSGGVCLPVTLGYGDLQPVEASLQKALDVVRGSPPP